MVAFTADVYKLLDDVKEEVSKNVHQVMQQLWLNWSHVGVEHDAKVANIYKLVQIEKDLHTHVLNESNKLLKEMQQQVEELKEETKNLGQSLSVDISIAEYREDMMLFEYRNELEEQISGYREPMKRRHMEINRLLEWQHELTEKLGATFHKLQEEPLPALEELDKLRSHLQLLQLEEFLLAQIEIKNIMEKLQIKPQNEFEHLVVSSLSVDFQVTDANMARLRRLLRDLRDQYDQTNNRVLELRERLSKLWESLDEDQIYRDNFLQANPGCHPETENAIKAEIKRCEDIKRQNLQEELDRLRSHLQLLHLEQFLLAQIEIKNIMEKLQIKPQNEFEHLVVSSLSVDFQVTDANMARLRRLLRDLRDQYDQTNNRVLELRERLSKLWESLDEDQIYRDNFLQANPGCHPETENAIKAEIKRCEDIKRQNLQEELDRLRSHLQLLHLEQFLLAQIEIKNIMEKLQIKPQNEFEHLVVSSLSVDFQVTDANMARLRRLLRDLRDQYDQTNNRVLELRERLSKLWESLDEDQIYRDNFLQANPGCHPETENAIKAEIKRCEDIKRQNLQVIIANTRTKIKIIWDNIMYSDQQREEFVHYYHNIFTEDTLVRHSMYLEKITNFYNDHKALFELVKTRKELWLKQAEIEARATQPGRYRNRGGHLLREERDRNRVESSLPAVHAELQELATRYEAHTGNPFTVDGAPLLQLIEQEKDCRKAERRNKLSSRKQLLTLSNPLLRSPATSPPAKRTRAAAGDNRRPARRARAAGAAAAAGAALASHPAALERPAISTLRRRVSGRVATAAVGASPGAAAQRTLGGGADAARTPRASGSILKHKRSAAGAGSRRGGGGGGRRSAGRAPPRGPLLEAPQLTGRPTSTDITITTDFENGTEENQICRSFMVPNAEDPVVGCRSPEAGPAFTPKKHPRKGGPMTPKTGKGNLQHNRVATTPKTDLMYSPTRLAGPSTEWNHDGFAALD